MRVEKRVLNDALRVLGKVVCQTSPVELYRSVRFAGSPGNIRAMATDGVEVVSVEGEAFTENGIDFCVPFKELKDLIRIGRSEAIELSGTTLEFPEAAEPSADARCAILPVDFGEMLAQAAPVINRNEYRKVLQGINLSPDGITVTDGKQLLHLPCHLSLIGDVTIPFPSALLAYRPQEMGTLCIWNCLFRIEIGGFPGQGRITEGQCPNWRGVIPSPESHDYSITLNEPGRVLDWVKMIPSQKTTNGVELNVMPDGSVTLVSCIQPDFKLNTSATVTGVRPRVVLTLEREIILRMLLQNYTTFKANSDGQLPVLACGGAGQYIAMPIRTIKTNSISKQEENKMENTQTVGSAPVQMVAPAVPVNNPETELNPLEELGNSIETFKLKLKVAFDDLAMLSRKVKEVQIQQRQKERDFIQARRAIERIRMRSEQIITHEGQTVLCRLSFAF